MNLKRKRKPTMIPLSAMGDIAFLLLVFYMATTMVTDQKPLDVDVARVDAANQPAPYPLVVYMDRELAARGEVFFFNQNVPLAALPAQIRDRKIIAPAQYRVYLNIEKDLPYSRMNDVIQALKEAEVSQLIITTRPVPTQ